jgi:hypothetical protein
MKIHKFCVKYKKCIQVEEKHYKFIKNKVEMYIMMYVFII